MTKNTIANLFFLKSLSLYPSIFIPTPIGFFPKAENENFDINCLYQCCFPYLFINIPLTFAPILPKKPSKASGILFRNAATFNKKGDTFAQTLVKKFLAISIYFETSIFFFGA